jgi:hypothetical protein
VLFRSLDGDASWTRVTMTVKWKTPVFAVDLDVPPPPPNASSSRRHRPAGSRDCGVSQDSAVDDREDRTGSARAKRVLNR